MALDFPASPSDGEQVTVAGVVFTYNATRDKWIRKQSFSNTTELTDLLAVDNDIVPDTDVTYDLGSSSKRWRDLYTSGSTIFLGSSQLTAPSGVLTLPTGSTIGSEEISTVSGPEIVATIDDLPSPAEAGTKAWVTGNNTLYLYNGSGWYKIAVVNESPTITSGGAGNYNFAQDGTAIVVTLTATDPEDLPLTWSYSVTSGSLGSTATVSQADNVFTITPSTDTANAGTFELTFTATDNIGNTALDANTFVLAFNSDYWPDISVSLIANSTTGLSNQTQNSYVNRGTAATSLYTSYTTSLMPQTTFHPFLENWSVEFDGSGDYLYPDSTSSSFAFGTADFTIEMWINLEDLSTNNIIYDSRPSNINGNYITWFVSTTGVLTYYVNNAVRISSSAGDISKNIWHHIAISRSGSSTKMFIDGTQVGSTYSDSTDYLSAESRPFIGSNSYAVSSYVHGYISNLRIVDGTAVYTSDFTPPTEKLTAISGTSLLTCQSYDYTDFSSNSHDVTPVGNPQVQGFSPFPESDVYAINEGKGSIGNPHSLKSIKKGIGFNHSFNTNEGSSFYIDFWYYHPASGANNNLISSKNGGSLFGFLHVDGSNLRISQRTSSKMSIPIATWNQYAKPASWSHHHLQYSRASGEQGKYSYYVNGTRVGYNGTAGTDNNGFDGITFGSHNTSASYNMTGYVSDFTMNNQNLHNHSATITVPTSPKNDTSKALYLPFDNAGISDYTGQTAIIPSNDNIVSSDTVTKYASSSIYVPNAADYMLTGRVIPTNGDVTIEGWFYFNFTNSNVYMLGHNTTYAANNSMWQLGLSGGNIAWWIGGSMPSNQKDPASASTNTWYHYAWVKNGTSYKIFKDGNQVVSFTNTAAMNNYEWRIGNTFDGGSQGFTGYIENLQIISGVAKYTSNFTAPTVTQDIINQLTS